MRACSAKHIHDSMRREFLSVIHLLRLTKVTYLVSFVVYKRTRFRTQVGQVGLRAKTVGAFDFANVPGELFGKQ